LRRTGHRLLSFVFAVSPKGGGETGASDVSDGRAIMFAFCTQRAFFVDGCIMRRQTTGKSNIPHYQGILAVNKEIAAMNDRSLIFFASVLAIGLAGTPALAEEGLTKDRIIFGQVAALEGPARALGQGMRQGRSRLKPDSRDVRRMRLDKCRDGLRRRCNHP
jgi:hypothetical protein